MLVAIHRRDVAARARDLDRHDLVVEPARFLRRDRALMGPERALVLLRAGDLILTAKVLRRLEHPARHRVMDAARGDAGPAEAVVEDDLLAARPPADRRRVELDLAHALRPAGQHDVAGPGLDLHDGPDHRLQAGAAPAVQLGAGDLDRQACVERGDAAQGRRLTVGVTLPEDDVVDPSGIDAGALDDRGDHGGAQGGRWHVLEHAAVAAYRGAD